MGAASKNATFLACPAPPRTSQKTTELGERLQMPATSYTLWDGTLAECPTLTCAPTLCSVQPPKSTFPQSNPVLLQATCSQFLSS